MGLLMIIWYFQMLEKELRFKALVIEKIFHVNKTLFFIYVQVLDISRIWCLSWRYQKTDIMSTFHSIMGLFLILIDVSLWSKE